MTIPGLVPRQYRPFPAQYRFLKASTEYQYRYIGAVLSTGPRTGPSWPPSKMAPAGLARTRSRAPCAVQPVKGRLGPVLHSGSVTL
jgi:hypothetical protein